MGLLGRRKRNRRVLVPSLIMPLCLCPFRLISLGGLLFTEEKWRSGLEIDRTFRGATGRSGRKTFEKRTKK